MPRKKAPVTHNIASALITAMIPAALKVADEELARKAARPHFPGATRKERRAAKLLQQRRDEKAAKAAYREAHAEEIAARVAEAEGRRLANVAKRKVEADERLRVEAANRLFDRKLEAKSKILPVVREYLRHKKLKTQNNAAVKIQAMVKGHMTRNHMAKQHASAKQIQALARGYIARQARIPNIEEVKNDIGIILMAPHTVQGIEQIQSILNKYEKLGKVGENAGVYGNFRAVKGDLLTLTASEFIRNKASWLSNGIILTYVQLKTGYKKFGADRVEFKPAEDKLAIIQEELVKMSEENNLSGWRKFRVVVIDIFNKLTGNYFYPKIDHVGKIEKTAVAAIQEMERIAKQAYAVQHKSKHASASLKPAHHLPVLHKEGLRHRHRSVR
jgi:hypothetical protein